MATDSVGSRGPGPPSRGAHRGHQRGRRPRQAGRVRSPGRCWPRWSREVQHARGRHRRGPVVVFGHLGDAACTSTCWAPRARQETTSKTSVLRRVAGRRRQHQRRARRRSGQGAVAAAGALRGGPGRHAGDQPGARPGRHPQPRCAWPVDGVEGRLRRWPWLTAQVVGDGVRHRVGAGDGSRTASGRARRRRARPVATASSAARRRRHGHRVVGRGPGPAPTGGREGGGRGPPRRRGRRPPASSERPRRPRSWCTPTWRPSSTTASDDDELFLVMELLDGRDLGPSGWPPVRWRSPPRPRSLHRWPTDSPLCTPPASCTGT